MDQQAGEADGKEDPKEEPPRCTSREVFLDHHIKHKAKESGCAEEEKHLSAHHALLPLVLNEGGAGYQDNGEDEGRHNAGTGDGF